MRWVESAIVVLFLIGGWLTNQATVHPNVSGLASSDNTGAAASWQLYDPDPNHVWNRLYRTLFGRIGKDGREYGYDELEPLLWSDTRFLLTKPSHQQAITVLDEFLATHAEQRISDPLKRAILQRDLWAVFDWSAGLANDSQEKRSLQIKLVQVMKRLALAPEEIATLPSTYPPAVKSKAFATAYDPNKRGQPFLPPDLFDPKGAWVSLGARDGSPVARVHADGFSGRSVFLIFVNLPEGRKATLAYLQRLSEVSQPGRLEPDGFGFMVDLHLPQLPAGTQLALVREMALIDSRGTWQSTGIVEDVQIRVHRTIPSEIPLALNTSRNEARTALDPFEFKFSRAKLFSGESGGLRPVAAEESEFATFLTHGIDWESRVSLKACASCHFRPGVFATVLSRGRGAAPSSDFVSEASVTKWWKARRYDWGLLQGLWRSLPDALPPPAR